jgi:hypothetical protein
VPLALADSVNFGVFLLGMFVGTALWMSGKTFDINNLLS